MKIRKISRHVVLLKIQNISLITSITEKNFDFVTILSNYDNMT